MTAIIISVLLALYFLGLIIPQKTLIPTADVYAEWKAGYPRLSAFIEALRLNDIYRAPVTVFFLALFFANLIIVLGHRIPVVLRKMYLLSPAYAPLTDAAARWDDAQTIRVSGGAQRAGRGIRTFLRKRLWSLMGGDGERTFFAVKNRYSPLGFLFFHASFLLCLIGGLLVMYTRFAGTLILTEGQEFAPDLKNFQRIYRDPKLMKELPPFFLRLEKVAPSYEQDVSTDLDVDLVLTYGGTAERTRLKVNKPVERGALSILVMDLGVSPLMVLRDRAGRELAGSFFSLNVLKGDEDSFEFPGMPYTFFVRFYPDFTLREGRPASRSPQMNNPVMQMTIKRAGKTVYEGLLPLAQSVSFDGLELAFEEARYWAEFYVVREYGNYTLFAGFLLGAVGLLMRLIFYQKTLRVAVREDAGEATVFLDGRSEYYPHAFRDELAGLARALQETLTRGCAEAGRAAAGRPPRGQGE